MIFVGFKRNFDLGARVRSSFGSYFEITMWIVFKPTLRKNQGGVLGFGLSLLEFFSYFLGFSRV